MCLDFASADEIAEIEKLRIQYPEVEEAIDEFSLMLEEAGFSKFCCSPLLILKLKF